MLQTARGYMRCEHIKLLLVEDQDDFACLVQDILADVTVEPFVVTHVNRLQAARQRLEEAPFDVTLLDLDLPDSRGLNTCSAIQAAAPAVPIVVLTGTDDEDIALQAVAMGAQEYVVKGRVDWRLLVRIIRHAIERKRMEMALRESEEFFRLISESISDLIVVLDLKGRRLYNSPSYRNVLGDPEKLVGTDSFAEIHPEDRDYIKQLFADTVRTGVGHRAEYRLLLADDSIRHIESRGNVIRDNRGNVLRVVVVSRDVTEQKSAMQRLHQALGDLHRSHDQLKTAQTQLVQTEKLQAVSTFAAGVAHEVMNPLQAISLGIDFLSHFRTSEDANANKVLTEMISAIQRADAVIRGLIDFSAFQKPETRFEQLNNIVRIAIATVDNELRHLGIETMIDLAAELPLLRLEEKTVRHVLINLLMHSMAAMPGGGRLTVWSRLRPSSPAREPWPFPSGESVVEVEIQDTGAALTGERNIPLTSHVTLGITEPLKPTALSLAVLRKIVELCGGALQIFSEPGFGNRFVLLFPVGPQPEP
jgi:PAS domain S-box-containing protein